MDLIAVIMAAPDPKRRFGEAAKLLNYGYANCKIYKDDGTDLLIPEVLVKRGVKESVKGAMKDSFSYLCLKDVNPAEITKEVRMIESTEAPLTTNDVIGEVIYSYQGKEIGKASIYPTEEVKKAGYGDYFKMMLFRYL